MAIIHLAKLAKGSLFSLALLAGAASDSLASVNVGDTVRFFRQEGGPDGGEFGVAVLPNSTDELFRTFCLQRNEELDFNAHGFIVDGISDRVQPQDDPLDARTAYLYTKFRDGTLSNYQFDNPGQPGSARELQEAIWFLEDELPSADGQAMAWVEEAAAAIADGLWSGLGSVRALNISWATERHGHSFGPAQDVLTLVETVPEPSSIVVWSLLGLAAGAVWRRKRNGGQSGSTDA